MRRQTPLFLQSGAITHNLVAWVNRGSSLHAGGHYVRQRHVRARHRCSKAVPRSQRAPLVGVHHTPCSGRVEPQQLQQAEVRLVHVTYPPNLMAFRHDMATRGSLIELPLMPLGTIQAIVGILARTFEHTLNQRAVVSQVAKRMIRVGGLVAYGLIQRDPVGALATTICKCIGQVRAVPWPAMQGRACIMLVKPAIGPVEAEAMHGPPLNHAREVEEQVDLQRLLTGE